MEVDPILWTADGVIRLSSFWGPLQVRGLGRDRDAAKRVSVREWGARTDFVHFPFWGEIAEKFCAETSGAGILFS